MTKTTLLLLCTLLSVSTFYACSDDSDRAVLTCDLNDEIGAEGSEIYFDISANGTWVLKSSADWAVPNHSAGKGDAHLKVIVGANDKMAPREATLTLKCGSASSSYPLKQAGSSSEYKQEMCYPKQNSANTLVIHNVDFNGKTTFNYTIEWNPKMKHAEWVAFYFDATNSKKEGIRSNDFVPDPDLPANMQTDNSYHTNDGFDRGHLCASYDRIYCQEANNQTFYFSNMSPQLNEFNAGIWQRLEQEVQQWGELTQSGKYDKVHVAKGGTLNHLLKNFKGSIPGKDGLTPTTDANGYSVKGLPVPEYYFMAVLTEKDGKYEAIGFLVNHVVTDVKENYDVSDLTKCAMSIDELEEFTGLDFFCNLPDATENKVESYVNINAWKW